MINRINNIYKLNKLEITNNMKNKKNPLVTKRLKKSLSQVQSARHSVKDSDKSRISKRMKMNNQVKNREDVLLLIHQFIKDLRAKTTIWGKVIILLTRKIMRMSIRFILVMLITVPYLDTLRNKWRKQRIIKV